MRAFYLAIFCLIFSSFASTADLCCCSFKSKPTIIIQNKSEQKTSCAKCHTKYNKKDSQKHKCKKCNSAKTIQQKDTSANSAPCSDSCDCQKDIQNPTAIIYTSIQLTFFSPEKIVDTYQFNQPFVEPTNLLRPPQTVS